LLGSTPASALLNTDHRNITPESIASTCPKRPKLIWRLPKVSSFDAFHGRRASARAAMREPLILYATNKTWPIITTKQSQVAEATLKLKPLPIRTKIQARPMLTKGS